MLFGTWLKGKKLEYMQKHGIKVEDFAKQVGYSVAHLKGLELNKKNPPPEDGLKSISKVLGLTDIEYQEMFNLACGSRLVIERTKIKKIFEGVYGAVSEGEFNWAISMFEMNEGIIVRLYNGILQESILRRLSKYVDKTRKDKSKEVPLVKLKVPEIIA